MSPLWYSVRKIMSGDPRPTSSDAVNGWMSWPGDRTVYRYSVFVRFSSLFCWRTFCVCVKTVIRSYLSLVFILLPQHCDPLEVMWEILMLCAS